MSWPPVRNALAALAALAVASFVSVGCGAGHDLDVKEGEPVELGDLSYNVQLTRFLNPKDAEDRAYLVGQPAPAADQKYLAVFIQVRNDGDSPATIAQEFRTEDTQHIAYRAIPSKSPYALDLGSSIGAHSQVPRPDTTAAGGPTEGAMILFLIKDVSTENRPLEMLIPGTGETARIELDI
jgi:hypothetical protein